ncbi:Uncharacterized protein DAT39_011046 [Clarias magur]|uniref:Uncharacterized protein n=1 Tax=Clarias magur TaxID=1594786 RepID=A0A8J4XAB3_CLAMG|nr:Uncharacterized protein DAT39_011046 [Clarias magur]
MSDSFRSMIGVLNRNEKSRTSSGHSCSITLFARNNTETTLHRCVLHQTERDPCATYERALPCHVIRLGIFQNMQDVSFD